MNKRVLRSALTVCLTLTLALSAVFPALGVATLTNFNSVRTYSDRFSDVPQDAWYYDYIRNAYERAVFDGTDGGLFKPNDRITIAETIKLAACLNKGYNYGTTWFEPGEPWYRPYVDYARQRNIITEEYNNYNAAATRADFAAIMARALPDEALTPINRVTDGGVPDVFESFGYGPAVYKLYRAGVFAGSDAAGTFYPGRTIRRAEAAAVVMRMIDADLRVSQSLAGEKTPEEIFTECSPAVFFIEIFDEDGDLVKTGSGFFISPSGLAVTNNHVITGARSARITTTDGETYDVSGMYSYDRKKDIALIQIDGGGFPYLETVDSDKLVTGAAVYTIGSPLGLQNSFSKGIISGAQRFIEGAEYIQIDAVISSGSSGGALIDTAGRVIGITSAAIDGGQSLNLAIPINLVGELDRETYAALDAAIISTAYYTGYYPAPDFGSYFEVKQYKPKEVQADATFSYLVGDLPEDPDIMLDSYAELLEQNLFTVFGYFLIDGNEFTAYYNPKHDLFVMTGLEKLDGKQCLTVQIS